jgi:peptidoglycan/LPS O-acetylase OafA/YrhL
MNQPKASARNAVDAPALPGHLYLLDALRGVAALAIVIFHWQHFFLKSGIVQTDQSHYPFYGVLAHFYQNGWMAVDLFFCLSGFIFYWLYAEAVASKQIKAGEFFALRFSRIYPLHLATLVLVLLGQLLYQYLLGHYFIDEQLTLGGFCSQLLLLDPWRNLYSYNLPSWSIAVEMFLYLVFFLLAVLQLRRWWQLLAMALVGVLVQNGVNSLIGRGLCSFFLGGLAYYFFAVVARRSFRQKLAVIAVLGVLVFTFGSLSGTLALYHAYRMLFGQHLLLGGRDLVGRLTLVGSAHLLPLVVFPFSLILLALVELQGCRLRHLGKFLGDISYSMYMLHFPLQVFYALVVGFFSASLTFYESPAALLLFFALLIPLAWLSHRYFERPIQTLLRKKFLG